MRLSIDRPALAAASGGRRYEQLVAALEGALDAGELAAGDRLPTVRALARQLGVSSASVATAYSVLERRGRVEAHVGRGTFVRAVEAVPPPRPRGILPMPGPVDDARRSTLRGSWRRQVLQDGDRLRALYPTALAATASWPDTRLLPIRALRRAYARLGRELTPLDLQYGGPDAAPALAEILCEQLTADGLPVQARELVIVASVAQLLALALRVVLGDGAGAASRSLVAVEEPGYHAAFNVLERLGQELVGVPLDGAGVEPAELAAALARGVRLVLLTPRAHNPTGVSWTAARRAELVDVLAAAPDVLVIEDDHFAGLAQGPSLSLGTDPRLAPRVVTVRSFSKIVAPDLRLSVAVARGRLNTQLREAQLTTGAWTSHTAQRVLALALRDPTLADTLKAARLAYAARRRAALTVLGRVLPSPPALDLEQDGLNVWVTLPTGIDAVAVLQRAAQLGVLGSNGEAFYLEPGHRGAVRLSVGRLEVAEARLAAGWLAQAIQDADEAPLGLVV